MPHGTDIPKIGNKFRTAENQQNPADSLTPAAQEPVAAYVMEQKIEPAQEPESKPQKKAKNTKSSSLRAKERDTSKSQRITFYATPEEYTDCIIAKARLRKPVTDIAREATMNLIYNGYICASCSKSFVLLNDENNKKEKPVACPCCGNNKLGRIVVL